MVKGGPMQRLERPLAFDEMVDTSGARPAAEGCPSRSARAHYRGFAQWLAQQPEHLLQTRRDEAELIFRRVGITFAVYGDSDGTERTIPFDIVPRIFPAAEWSRLERGLKQRVQALNMFLHDVYHEQHILKAGLIPAEQVLNNAQYRPQMQGVRVPHNIYAHIAGIDIVRANHGAQTGELFVLEDNLRVPSGVSYMLENRKMMMRLFPELFAQHRVEPVAHYPDLLLDTLRNSGPADTSGPNVVVLTPGMYNSAYFEHAFLAQQMGVELVEGQDLFVQDDTVFMRTTQGPQRVDVIYRRVDDDFLDPEIFREDSTLGATGLLRAYRSGNVAICNAIGTGVADDKSIYPFVPDMIRFYLSEEPLIANVPTFTEGGVKGVDQVYGWSGIFYPASTPSNIVNKVQQALASVLRQPEMKKQFDELGLVPIASTPADFSKYVAQDIELQTQLFKTANIAQQ
jgi:uncharacterized circularly permuted ATP-grasp superfamily protein